MDFTEGKLNASQNGSIKYENLLRKTPPSPGFLVSFLVDARGGAMSGQRHSGVDIIIPPSKVCMPTRLTCRLVKKEKIRNLPHLGEEEAFASRVLELGPMGTKFIGLVLIELPHFASRIGQDRELVVLKSDNGLVWQEHTEPQPSEKIEQTFSSIVREHSGDGKQVVKIYTSYFPKYFVAVSKAKHASKMLDAKSNTLQCSTSHIILPGGSVNRETKISLEVLSVTKEMAHESLGVGLESSNIVSIKPLRRKFHQPIKVGISVKKELQEKIRNHRKGSQSPPALLLYSISEFVYNPGSNSPASWEDITISAPYVLDKDTISFTTMVSARYWLVENNAGNILEEAKALYSEATAVPFFACFYVLAKKHSDTEVQVRILCMNDGDFKQTLEHEEHFVHLATSSYVEVANGKSYNVEISGNMVPSAASPGQLFLIFHAFRVNRLSYMARVQDQSKPLSCQISIFKNNHIRTKQPLCTLDIALEHLHMSPTLMSPEAEEKWREAFEKVKENFASQDNINKTPELKLLDIADQLKGDWVALAGQLGITSKEVAKLQSEYGNINEQAILMLHLWVDKMKNQAKASHLEVALRRIGREDIVENCISTTDSKRKSDEPVQLIDDSFHEDVHGSTANASNGFEEVQEGCVYELEDVWDGSKWQKTKKMVPTLVEDPIMISEVKPEEGPLSDEIAHQLTKAHENEVTIQNAAVPSLKVTKFEDDMNYECHNVSLEESQEVLDDGMVVKVTKVRSTQKQENSSN